MTREEAINVIAQVCNQWTGKIAEAELVKEAFLILTSEPVPPPGDAAPPNRAARRAKGPTKKAARS